MIPSKMKSHLFVVRTPFSSGPRPDKPPTRHALAVHVGVETRLDVAGKHAGHSRRHFVHGHALSQLRGRVPGSEQGGESGKGDALEEANDETEGVHLGRPLN